MLKFHIIIIKFSNFTDKNSESDTFFPKLKNTIVRIDIQSFSVHIRLVHFIFKFQIFMRLKNLDIPLSEHMGCFHEANI